MNTAESPPGGALVPPAPGSRVGEVAVFYTETARAAVPGWDLELVPLSGKSPDVGGLAWQTHASSSAAGLLERLKGLGVAARRVDGWGALMNKHVCFDIDHPEFLPAGLLWLLQRGLVNETRPGRAHYLFRVPAGRRFGGGKEMINRLFPPVDGGSWGEIKGFNSQVRIWSPNGDGTHVALVPGEIPELPIELAAGLSEPEFLSGDPLSAQVLSDWLDAQTGAAHPDWLAVDIARLPDLNPSASDNSKNRRLLTRVFHVANNVAAGMYAGRTAYDELHSAWVDLCAAEGDYIASGPDSHERKYQGIWRRVVGKITTDPGCLAQIEEKRTKIWGGTSEPLDMDDPEVVEFVGWLDGWADREGVRGPSAAASGGPGPAELSDADAAAMLAAVDGDAADQGVPVPVPAVPPAGPGPASVAERMASKLEALGGGAGPGPALRVVPALPVESESESEEKPQVDASSSAVNREEAPAAGRPAEDDESRASSDGPGPAAAPAPSEPASSSGDGDGSGAAALTPYEKALEGIRESKLAQVIAERDRILIRGIAQDWVDEHKGTSVLPTLHRERPSWTAVPAPDGLLRTDGIGLLYRGLPTTHALIGGKGSGKSTLGAVAAVEWMAAGSSVVWVDFEVGLSIVYNQFLTVRADPGLCERLLSVVAMVGEKGGLEGVATAILALEVVPGLVVLDSVSRAIARAGMNENDAAAFIGLVDEFADRLREKGSSVLVIDHMGHEDKTRGRGTSAKGDQIDCELTVEVLAGWSRTSEGATRLTCRKDRRGYMTPDRAVAVVTYSPDLAVVDVDRRPLDVVVLPPVGTGAAAWVALGAAVEAGEIAVVVTEILTDRGVGAELSENQLDKEVRAKGVKRMSRDTLRDALSELESEGLLSVREGKNRSRLWSLAE